MIHDECRPIFESSKILLVKSGLVGFSRNCFVAKEPEKEFEKYWARDFDPEYGRYMAWVWFSVGAENLLKAALVCCTPLTGIPQNLGYPVFTDKTNKASWVNKVLHPQQGAYGDDEAQKYEYHTLDWILNNKYDDFARTRNIPKTACEELKAAYIYLTKAVRNRDAHTYVKDQRIKDFPAVKGIFVPAFNILVKTMKDNRHFSATSGN